MYKILFDNIIYNKAEKEDSTNSKNKTSHRIHVIVERKPETIEVNKLHFYKAESLQIKNIKIDDNRLMFARKVIFKSILFSILRFYYM